MVSQARQIADGMVRFSTASTNQAVAKLATETGFQLVATYIPFEIKTQSGETQKFWQLKAEHFPQILTWLDRSEYFEESLKSFEFRWKWWMATEVVLRDYLDEGCVYGWNPDGDGKTLMGLLIINSLYEDSDGETMVSVAFGDTQADLRRQLWVDVAAFVGSLGGDYAHVKVVGLPAYTEPLAEADWEADDIRPVLYSRPIQMTMESNVQHEMIPPIE